MSLRHIIYAFISGIFLWLGWPTYGFVGLLFVAFVPLLLAERSLRKKKVDKAGLKIWLLSYIVFFIWNLGTTYWLYYSTPFGMWFAVLVNSLLMSLVFMVYHFVARRSTQEPAITFLISLWITFEWMHLHWDFSWPWLNLGNGFSENVGLIQWYEFTGTMGGTLWVWIINVLIYRAIVYSQNLLRSNSKLDQDERTRKIAQKAILPSILLISPIAVSLILTPSELGMTKGSIFEVLVLQPNIDPYSDKYDVPNEDVALALNDMIVQNISEQTDLILAPETVLADHVRTNRLSKDTSINILNQTLNRFPYTSFIGGISLLEVFTSPQDAQDFSNLDERSGIYYNDYNSAIKLEKNLEIETYHKSRLVVGVEHFPYRSILEPLLGDAMIDLGGSTSTKGMQKNAEVFTVGSTTQIAPIICYESVYGEYVGDFVAEGAQVLAIITNDAWWGNTQGHKQHLSLARLRAIEHRKWVTRSANTGISAIIDPSGIIKSQLAYEEKGAILESVYLNDDRTFYTTNGDYIARIAAFMALFVFLFSVLRRGKLKRK